jgi:Xaa-Pro aminopeptidase
MFSNEEMDRRRRLVREAMSSAGYDWLIASTGHPFGYVRWLTDRSGLGGPLAAIGLAGDVLLATHGDDVHHKAVDSYGVRNLVSCAQLNMMVNSHAGLLVDAFRAKPVRKIGLLGTGFIPVAAYQIIRDAFPDAEISDATDLVVPIKARKSAEEMVCMRRAAAMHDAAIDVVRATVAPGVTAKDVVDEVRYAVTRAGSPTQSLMAGSAPPGTICKYAGPLDRPMQNGDQFAMLIECSEQNGYYSEAMPTVCLGDIPAELQVAFDHVVEAQEMLAAMVRPGMSPAALLAANDAFLAERGYPPETRLLGHSQGVDLVERPAFSPLGENLPIEAGTVISIHPTTHGEKAWGYPVNMSFYLGENGLERLLKTPQEIIVV